jgi:hypothetical protein
MPRDIGKSFAVEIGRQIREGWSHFVVSILAAESPWPEQVGDDKSGSQFWHGLLQQVKQWVWEDNLLVLVICLVSHCRLQHHHIVFHLCADQVM